MSTPQSLKTSFLSLPKSEWADILQDDYCHKKFETLKLKASSLKNSSFNYKGVWDLKTGLEKQPTFILSDEFKFGFQIMNKYYLQTRLKRNGEIKYHFDLGTYELGKQDVNLFTNIKTNPKFEEVWLRFGLTHFGKHCESLLRVERDSFGESMLTLKNVLKHQNIKTGVVSIFNLNRKALTRYDASIAYHYQNFDFALQHNSPKTPNGISLGKIMAAVAYKINNDHRVALQFKKNLLQNKVRFVLGGESEINKDLNLKAKIDSKGKTTIAGKYKLCKSSILTVGAQLNLQKGLGAFDFNKILPIPIGYSIEMTI